MSFKIDELALMIPVRPLTTEDRRYSGQIVTVKSELKELSWPWIYRWYHICRMLDGNLFLVAEIALQKLPPPPLEDGDHDISVPSSNLSLLQV